MTDRATTFHARWTETVDRHGGEPFLLFHQDDGGTTAWTYREFDEVVSRTAGTLRALGVGPGDAVHLVLRNCPAFVASWLAVARLGAWMVPVDPASTARDIATQIRRTRPAVALAAQERLATYREGAGSSSFPVVAVTETVSDVAPGAPLVDGTPVVEAAVPVEPRDRLAVMFTSGTTSEPKGVVLTQHNYAHVAVAMAEAVHLQRGHRWLVTLPLFHANAQYYCFAPAIAVGASIALTASFSASRWLWQAHELGATHASLFAAPIRMILARSGEERPPLALQHVWFAQSLGAQHYDRFAELVGCRPRQLYGMTETVAAVTADTSAPLRHDVIGEPLAGRTVAVVDPDRHRPVNDGEPGLLLVHGTRGRDLFAEYLDDPVTTAASFADGDGGSWLRTGDLVQRDRGTGVLRFVGRVDDVIKVAGENVSLTEVEAVLAQAPDVLEAAVVARPDAVRDQIPVAYVVPADPTAPPDLDALEAWAVDHLAPQARPRGWHVIEALPRTSVGKVRRFQVTSAGDGAC